MVFSSTLFLFLFLPAVLAAYGAAALAARLAGGGSKRLPNLVLLAASLFFYAWGEGQLVLLMLASIAGNYLFGLALGARRSRWVLAGAVVFNLGLLGWFKYASFAAENLGRALTALGGEPPAWVEIALPIGISFFTFQALSYVIDVWRGEVAVQRDPLAFALYVALFPQLIAGPIVRYRDVAVALEERTTSLEDYAEGVRRFVIGLGKKMLIANPLGAIADSCFDAPPSDLTAAAAWLGALAYTFQIYFDFSGYSDMAIGLGRLFGFRFLENFRWPYVARSITEFWRRWHISLSSWFRDYLYIPLGGNRQGRGRTLANLLVVFALCGLWHGAAWNFLLWGLYHGVFLVLERSGGSALLARAPRALRHVYVLLVALVGWVFFRAESLEQALAYCGALLGGGASRSAFEGVALSAELWWNPLTALTFAAAALGSTPWLPALVERVRARGARSPLVALCEGGALVALALVFLLSLLELSGGTHNPFIYYRF